MTECTYDHSIERGFDMNLATVIALLALIVIVGLALRYIIKE